MHRQRRVMHCAGRLTRRTANFYKSFFQLFVIDISSPGKAEQAAGYQPNPLPPPPLYATYKLGHVLCLALLLLRSAVAKLDASSRRQLR